MRNSKYIILFPRQNSGLFYIVRRIKANFIRDGTLEPLRYNRTARVVLLANGIDCLNCLDRQLDDCLQRKPQVGKCMCIYPSAPKLLSLALHASPFASAAALIRDGSTSAAPAGGGRCRRAVPRFPPGPFGGRPTAPSPPLASTTMALSRDAMRRPPPGVVPSSQGPAAL